MKKQIIEVLKDIASLFIPEKIIIDGDVVTARFLSETLSTIYLSEIKCFVFHTHNPFTGGKMLEVLTNEGAWYHYHKQDIGFDSLLRELIKRANLSSDTLKTFSKSGYPPDLFTWGSKE